MGCSVPLDSGLGKGSASAGCHSPQAAKGSQKAHEQLVFCGVRITYFPACSVVLSRMCSLSLDMDQTVSESFALKDLGQQVFQE